MFEGTLKVSGQDIPRTLLGTSPFVAAAHFGHRARLYQLDFYNNPENILKIIIKSHEMGIRGIQLIPHTPVVEAVKYAQESGQHMDVIGTVRPGNEEEDIEILADLDAISMMIHIDTAGKKEGNVPEEHLQAIKDEGAITGIVTHMPFQSTQSLIESPLLDLFDLYMVPVNKLGYLMDCDTYGPEERSNLSEMIKNLDKTVIAETVLAAGILRPNEAFDYLKTVDFTDSVALGIASEKEAMETFSILTSK